MQLVQGAVRPNVGDMLTKFGGRGAPWTALDDGNKDAEVVKERELGMHDIRGGAKIDLNRGGPPKTEKRPFRYAFQGGLLGKDANNALNHRDEVLVRHSVIGFPRWDAEGEPVAEEEDGAEGGGGGGKQGALDPLRPPPFSGTIYSVLYSSTSEYYTSVPVSTIVSFHCVTSKY